MTTIHEAIRLHRLRKKLSQQELAEAVSRLEGRIPPLSYQAVQKWEDAGPNGTAPSRKRLPFVAQALGITVGELTNPKDQSEVTDQDREYSHAHQVSDIQPIMAPKQLEWESLMKTPLPSIFLLRMQDDAIGEVVSKGRNYVFSTVEVDPPKSADVVLVEDASGNLFCRIFEAGRNGNWRAVATTAGYRALDSADDGLRVLAIGMGPWGRRG